MANGRDDDKALDSNIAAVNAAAAKARATWIVLLSFGAYLAVAVGATTHRDLFLESPIALPILGVELPLVAFYVVAPALFVIMHLYLLVSLSILGERIRLFEADLPADADEQRIRARLEPFLILQKLAGGAKSGVPRDLLVLAVLATVVAGPVVLLVFFQVQFLPYHNESVAWWHRLLILADVALLWRLWPLTIHKSDQSEPELLSPLEAFRRTLHPAFRSLRARANILFDRRVPARDRGRLICSHRAEPEHSAQPAPPARSAVLVALVGTTFVAFFSMLVATVPDERVERWLTSDGWFELRDRDDQRVWGPTARLFEGGLDRARARLNSPFSRSLVLPDADLIAMNEEQLGKVERTLTLRDRDLRYAILINADLRKAELAVPDLRGARLDGAKLGGTLFRCARRSSEQGDRQAVRAAPFRPDDCPQLQGASLDFAELQGASLEHAQLQGASLDRAQLQGASLDRAQLQGASLDQAQLQGASLQRARLQGASLERADLRGASFDNAHLHGAHLRHARLQAASLQGAQLQAASLEWAQLQGAWLFQTDLHGVILGRGDLSGASADYSWLWRSDVTRSRRHFVLSCMGSNFEPMPTSVFRIIRDSIHYITDSNRQRLTRRRIEKLEHDAEDDGTLRAAWGNTSCLHFPRLGLDQELADTLIDEVLCNSDMFHDGMTLGTRTMLRRMEEERRFWERYRDPFRPYHALVAKAVLDEGNAQCAGVREALSATELMAFQSFLDEAAPPPVAASPPDGVAEPEPDLAPEPSVPALREPANANKRAAP